MNAKMDINTPFASLSSLKSVLPTEVVTAAVKDVNSAERDRKVRNVMSTVLKGAGVPVASLEVAVDDMLAAFAAVIGGKPKSTQVAEAILRTPQAKAEMAKLAEKYRPVPVQVPMLTPESPAVATVSVKKVNNLLPAVEERLHAQLLAAVQSGEDAQVDDALRDIVSATKGLFVTRFQNWTRVSSLLIGRLNTLGLRFRLEWTDAEDGGLGSEVLPKKKPAAAAMPVLQGLNPDEMAELLATLRAVMQDGTQRQLEDAVRALVDACRQRGVVQFATPYKPHAFASRLLMKAWGRVKGEGESFWFDFPANGIEMEECPTPRKETSAKRKEMERRRAANRADRLRDQPKKGPTGHKPENRKK